MQSELIGDLSKNLLVAAEDLFYVIYARLKSEISNIELRQTFHFDIPHLVNGRLYPVHRCLPEPNHLKHIFQACLALLKSDEVGGPLDQEILRQEQADRVEKAMKSVVDQGHGPSNTPTPSGKQFRGLGLRHDASPAMVLGTLAEKYRGRYHKTTSCMSEGKHEEWRRILANREACYAKLSGTTVGEHRRREGQLGQHQYLREKLCICFGACHCAKRCTDRGHRICPCNARLSMKSRFKEVDLHGSFGSRMSDEAARITEMLSEAKRSTTRTDLATMLAGELASFPQEVILLRRLVSRLSKTAISSSTTPAAASSTASVRHPAHIKNRSSPAALLAFEASTSMPSANFQTRTGNRRPGAAWVPVINTKLVHRTAG